MSHFVNGVTPSATSKSSTDWEDGTSMKSASPAGTTASSGTKRKRNADPKFYAVRVGNRPGIYHSWKDCLEQVKGFKNATFKSFPSLTDAERFIRGEDPSRGGNGTSFPPYKFYAVRSGRVPGIYTDWPSAQRQITGWTKPKQKCFSTRAEAQRFLDEGDSKLLEGTDGMPLDKSNGMSEFSSSTPESSTKSTSSKKPKKTASAVNGTSKAMKLFNFEYSEEYFDAGMGPLPLDAEDGFDPNIMLDPVSGTLVYKTQTQMNTKKLQAVSPNPDGMLRIYTDGSSIGNGKAGALAGVGVYFGPSDRRNISEALPGTRQTNQRAELTAIVRALDTTPRDRDVTIVTDSQYSINCVTAWSANWRKNGWKTSAGKQVENKDLVENILAKIEERNSLQSQTEFEWIKGHAKHPGNEAADRLAVEGARSTIR